VHIPDGFLTAPTAIATGVVSAGALAQSVRTAGKSLNERQIPLVGLTAAFIFAVQMINFPVGLGTSGHLIGGALAAILLGPWLATLVLSIVLIVQAIGFADGGITALGANISLMGLVAGMGAYLIFSVLVRLLPRTRTGYLAATAATAWASVVAASVLCSVYLLLRGFPSEVFGVMVGLHALIGIGEAVITTAVVGAVVQARPELVATRGHLPAAVMTPSGRVSARRSRAFVLLGLGLSLFIAMGVSAFASSAPDGLESAVLRAVCDGDEACLEERAGEAIFDAAPLADYAITPLSGLVGVVATFAVGAGIVGVARTRRGVARRRRSGSDTHAPVR